MSTHYHYITLPCYTNDSVSVLTAFFPGKPGLVGFIGAKDEGGGGSNCMCKALVKSSPPTTNQHTMFYRPDALPVTQPTVSEHRCHHFWHATHNYVAPHITHILHRDRFWAISIASGSVRLWDLRSCSTVLSHVMRGILEVSSSPLEHSLRALNDWEC